MRLGNLVCDTGVLRRDGRTDCAVADVCDENDVVESLLDGREDEEGPSAGMYADDSSMRSTRYVRVQAKCRCMDLIDDY